MFWSVLFSFSQCDCDDPQGERERMEVSIVGEASAAVSPALCFDGKHNPTMVPLQKRKLSECTVNSNPAESRSASETERL